MAVGDTSPQRPEATCSPSREIRRNPRAELIVTVQGPVTEGPTCNPSCGRQRPWIEGSRSSGDGAQWQSTCLAKMRSKVQSSALQRKRKRCILVYCWRVVLTVTSHALSKALLSQGLHSSSCVGGCGGLGLCLGFPVGTPMQAAYVFSF